ncbi:General transcription factor IIF subunit 2 [Portunus trituberculatus]|uniref:General transcription factor IIF subunit 2 n=1 Tax=Portunus trituberculatus TaxID=210409 RepID=A0A5B7I1K0_PORTR|nr:General transcription factor IIF subunit 2 [Portunus trituberculatus]
MEGQVIQKFECQPVVDSYYYNQKKAAALIASQPHRKAEFISRPVQSYKPKTRHKVHVSFVAKQMNIFCVFACVL